MNKPGHCGHAPKCVNVDPTDERDPLGCCNCGTRENEHPSSDVVYEKENLWYFYDESGDEWGPFKNKESCEKALDGYCRCVLEEELPKEQFEEILRNTRVNQQ